MDELTEYVPDISETECCKFAALAWTTEKNKHKTFDPDLAEAFSTIISDIVNGGVDTTEYYTEWLKQGEKINEM